jgi:transcription termination factor NusB
MTSASGEGTSRWGGRRRAREAALQMLYLTEIGKLSAADVAQSHTAIGEAAAIELDEESRGYAMSLARGAWDDRATIDAYVAEAAKNWRLERLAVVDRLLCPRAARARRDAAARGHRRSNRARAIV